MKRRTFLQNSALGSIGLVTAQHPLSAHLMIDRIKNFGFQAYTVRSVIYKDMAGTLKRLNKAGYDYVELFDFANGKILGKSIAEGKAIIDQSKLKVKSIHVPTGAGDQKIPGTIWHEFQQAIDDAKTLGSEFLVCPYLMDFERETIDQYKALAQRLNEAGEMAKKSGIQLAYHNHDFEFQKLEGQVPMDILLQEMDPELVKIELDIYWARKAEVNPLTFFKDNLKRVPLWHVKDLSVKEGYPMTEVGNGIIDWKQIFRHQEDAGLSYFFVEQDGFFEKDAVSSLETSIKYLKKLSY